VEASLALILYATGQYQSLGSISTQSYLFLLLSGLATGASWICYFPASVSLVSLRRQAGVLQALSTHLTDQSQKALLH